MRILAHRSPPRQRNEYDPLLLQYHLLFLYDFPPPTPFAEPEPLYFVLPQFHGTYLCFIMCLICRFIVKTFATRRRRSRVGEGGGGYRGRKCGRGVGGGPGLARCSILESLLFLNSTASRLGDGWSLGRVSDTLPLYRGLSLDRL